MSLIYGIFDFKKNKNVSEKLVGMNIACSPPRFDGSDHFVNRQVGLGNILRYNTPESVFENMPFSSGDLTITAFARIDNRSQLFNLLEIPITFQKEMPDSVLILKAYQKWEKECVNHLEGDWAFAIWNNAEQELFVARDQYGNTGLYYYKSADFFAFSSSIKGLFAIKEIPLVLNEKLIVNKLNSSLPETSTTGYQNIKMLPSAHSISVGENQFDLKRYWDMGNVSILNLKSADDYIQGFLEIYKNAVNVRMRSYGKIGSTLSGGLDSGSVSALAALELKKQNKRLDAYTSVPIYDPSSLISLNKFGDETDFAAATAEFSGNIDLHLIKGERISVLEGVIKILEIHDCPSHAAANAFWMLELMQTAKEHGVSTLLTGQCGNASVSWTGMPSVETITSILSKYRNDKINLLGLIRKLVKLVLPQSIIDSRVKKTSLEDLVGFSAINLNFAKKMLRERIMAEEEIVPDFTPSKKNALENRLKILKPESNNVGLLWQENGYTFDLNILDPTKDKQLIDYCLSIPDDLYRDSEHDRLIIRKSMDKILPEKVQWNMKRGLQAADLQYRVRDSYSEIDQILKRFEQSKLVNHYIDTKRMRSSLEEVRFNISKLNAIGCGAILVRGISVGLFLQRFE